MLALTRLAARLICAPLVEYIYPKTVLFTEFMCKIESTGLDKGFFLGRGKYLVN